MGLDESANTIVNGALKNPIQQELYVAYPTTDNFGNTITVIGFLGEALNALSLGIGNAKVYASFEGAIDTALGLYSQDPSSNLRNPAAVIYWFLDKFTNYSSHIDRASFYNLLAARNGWYFDGSIDEEEPVKDVLARLCFECAANYVWSGGSLYLKPIDLDTPIIKYDLAEGINIADDPVISWDRTAVADIRNDFTLKYYWGWPQNNFRETMWSNKENSPNCLDSYVAYRTIGAYSYESKYIKETGTAIRLMNHFESMWCFRKYIATIPCSRILRA